MRMYWSYLFELMCVFLCVWKLVLFPCASDESQLAKSYCLLFQYILPSLFTFGNVFACHVPVSSPLTPWKSHTNLVCCCNRSCYFAVAAADAIIDGTLKHQSSADPLSHADGPTPLKNVFKNQNLAPLDTGYTPPKTNMAMDNQHFWYFFDGRYIFIHACFSTVILIFRGGGGRRVVPPVFSHGCLIPEDFTTSWQSSAAVLHNSQPDTIWGH